MINLFDNYGQKTRDLHHSLMASGYNNKTIIVNEDGFLPKRVTSPYAFYIHLYEDDFNPTYFNQIVKPDYWEIRGTNLESGVYDKNMRRANVIYTSNFNSQRIVSRVEWLDGNNGIRSVDHYGISGWRFAQTSYNIKHQKIMTTYYTKDKKEVIVENYQTKNIILNQDGKVIVFKSKSDFVAFFIKSVGYNDDHVLYNSLSVPFLVTYAGDISKKDWLFWQEDIDSNGELPGNMVALLTDIRKDSLVIFQDKRQYDQVVNQHPEYKEKILHIGNVYPITKHHRDKTSRALILTNSDHIEKLDQLVSALPEVEFHIAALTEMSDKLMDFGKIKNVVLHPNVSNDLVDRLRKICAIYLDINHGSEIMAATRQAFLNNQLILSFTETSHGLFTVDNNKFNSEDVRNMISLMNDVSENITSYEQKIIEQHQYNNQTDISIFRNAINSNL